MKKVFEYMRWCDHNFDRFHKCRVCNKMANHSTLKIHCLDGNDMVLAINKMVEKGDLGRFIAYIIDNDLCKLDQNYLTVIEWSVFTSTLFGNPTNFFTLMEEWLSTDR